MPKRNGTAGPRGLGQVGSLRGKRSGTISVVMTKRKHPNQPPRQINREGYSPRPAPRQSALRAGRYWLFGHHPVASALNNPSRDAYRLKATAQGLAQLDPVLLAQAQAKLSIESIEPRDLDRLLPDGAVHQGLALEVAPLDPCDLAEVCSPDPGCNNLILMLDQVTDPHNVGAILRSAAAFGARAVVTTDRHAPPETGTLAKSASGALDIIPLVRVVNLVQALDRLAEMGYWRIGLTDQATADLSDLDFGANIVLALGAEGAGLRRLTLEHCDAPARLPTNPAMPSLNVSNAAAVALYELARRRI